MIFFRTLQCLQSNALCSKTNGCFGCGGLHSNPSSFWVPYLSTRRESGPGKIPWHFMPMNSLPGDWTGDIPSSCICVSAPVGFVQVVRPSQMEEERERGERPCWHSIWRDCIGVGGLYECRSTLLRHSNICLDDSDRKKMLRAPFCQSISDPKQKQKHISSRGEHGWSSGAAASWSVFSEKAKRKIKLND